MLPWASQHRRLQFPSITMPRTLPGSSSQRRWPQSSLSFPGIGPSFSFLAPTSTAGGLPPGQGRLFSGVPHVFFPLHEGCSEAFSGGYFGAVQRLFPVGILGLFRGFFRWVFWGCSEAFSGGYFGAVQRLFPVGILGLFRGFFRWVFWGCSEAFSGGYFCPKWLLTDYFGPKVVAHFHFFGGAIFSLFAPATFFVICAVAV